MIKLTAQLEDELYMRIMSSLNGILHQNGIITDEEYRSAYGNIIRILTQTFGHGIICSDNSEQTNNNIKVKR